MQKLEYLEVSSANVRDVELNGIRHESGGALHALFNRLGEEGWELVTVDNINRFFFKRPKR